MNPRPRLLASSVAVILGLAIADWLTPAPPIVVLGAQPQTAPPVPAVPEFRSMAGVDPKALQLWRLVPGPDFGTIEATNRIGAASGFVDVVGIKPGMTADAVVAVLKGINPAFMINSERLSGYPPAPANAGPVTAVSATVPDNLHQIRIKLTWPPAKSGVFAVERQIDFAPGQEPTMTTLLGGLRTKYGAENGGEPLLNQHIWTFNGQGPLAKLPASCAAFIDASVGGNPFQTFEESVAHITQGATANGVPAGWLRIGPPGCIEFTVIEARIGAAGGGLALNVNVRLRNKLFEQSAWVTYVNVAEAWQAEQVKRRLDGARGRGTAF